MSISGFKTTKTKPLSNFKYKSYRDNTSIFIQNGAFWLVLESYKAKSQNAYGPTIAMSCSFKELTFLTKDKSMLKKLLHGNLNLCFAPVEPKLEVSYTAQREDGIYMGSCCPLATNARKSFFFFF